VKNLVEPDIVPLARYARENGFESLYRVHAARRAEALGSLQGTAGRRHDRDAFREISPLTRPDPDPRAPASEYVYEDGGGMVGSSRR